MGQLAINRTERGMNKPGVTLLVSHLVQLQSLLMQTRVVFLFRCALMFLVRTVCSYQHNSDSEGLIENDNAGDDDIDVIDACPELMITTSTHKKDDVPTDIAVGPDQIPV